MSMFLALLLLFGLSTALFRLYTAIALPISDSPIPDNEAGIYLDTTRMSIQHKLFVENCQQMPNSALAAVVQAGRMCEFYEEKQCPAETHFRHAPTIVAGPRSVAFGEGEESNKKPWSYMCKLTIQK